MDPATHMAGCLLSISNGQIAQPYVNVDRAPEVGSEQLIQFEGLHKTLAKQVVTFDKHKRLSVGENYVVNQGAIYVCIIGILVHQHGLDLQQVLATELTAPSIINVTSGMPDSGCCKDNAFLCDDTDMFALLVYIFSKEKCKLPWRWGHQFNAILTSNIKVTARKHAAITSILPLHD